MPLAAIFHADAVEGALQLAFPLATFDDDLRRAALDHGIEVLGSGFQVNAV